MVKSLKKTKHLYKGHRKPEEFKLETKLKSGIRLPISEEVSE